MGCRFWGITVTFILAKGTKFCFYLRQIRYQKGNMDPNGPCMPIHSLTKGRTFREEIGSQVLGLIVSARPGMGRRRGDLVEWNGGGNGRGP